MSAPAARHAQTHANNRTPPSSQAFGASSVPSSGCRLLYDETVALAASVPALAWGPGMKTVAAHALHTVQAAHAASVVHAVDAVAQHQVYAGVR